jgi:hypothetical protein
LPSSTSPNNLLSPIYTPLPPPLCSYKSLSLPPLTCTHLCTFCNQSSAKSMSSRSDPANTKMTHPLRLPSWSTTSPQCWCAPCPQSRESPYLSVFCLFQCLMASAALTYSLPDAGNCCLSCRKTLGRTFLELF